MIWSVAFLALLVALGVCCVGLAVEHERTQHALRNAERERDRLWQALLGLEE